MQCNFHDRGIRCTQTVTTSAPYCETHAEPTPRATREAITRATQPTREAIPGATESWLEPTKNNFPGQAVISMDDPRWKCIDEDCRFCSGDNPNIRCHYFLERTRTQCGFYPIRGRQLCINHDPSYREQHRTQSAAGGRANYRPRSNLEVGDINVSLRDRSGIQALLHTVIALELVGQISPARSRNIVRALAVAARNFDDTSHSNRVVQSDSHRHDVAALLRFANNFTEEAAINDAPPEPPPGDENQKEVLKALGALSRVTRR